MNPRAAIWYRGYLDIVNILTTKSAVLEVTGGQLSLELWQIDDTFEPTRLIFMMQGIWTCQMQFAQNQKP